MSGVETGVGTTAVPVDGLEAFLDAHPGADFDRDGLKLHYLDEGAGPPVVMVHGNPTWSFAFRHLIDGLKSDHRVIALDHVGCGRSDKPRLERYAYTLKDRVDDLEALLDHLGVDREVTLVLHDWGGMIGMAYASRHPERVARIVLMNTAAFPLPAAKSFPLALRICRDSTIGARLVRHHNAFCRVAARVCVQKRPLSTAVRQAYLAPYDTPEHRVATLRFVQDIPLGPGDPSWPIVASTAQGLNRFRDLPMLILWGMKDFVFDRHFLEEWERRFPAAEVHRFPQAGHYVFEDERDQVVTRVHAFLQAHPLGEARG